jgi:serine/threonine protein kinase
MHRFKSIVNLYIFIKMESRCKKWKQSPDVNPTSGRKIKINGPTYKKLRAECDKISKQPQSPFVTAKTQSPLPAVGAKQQTDCAKWKTFPDVNPATGRKIKINGPTYKILRAECDKVKAVDARQPAEPYVQDTDEKTDRINNGLAKINVNQWDTCLSGNKTKFRESLVNVKKIGRGSFGEVYSTKIGTDTVVVKESYLYPDESRILKQSVKPQKIGQISKNLYPREYALLKLLQNALTLQQSPNFLRVYNLAVCDGCHLQKGEPGSCYLTFMEPADGDLGKPFRDGIFSSSQQYSILYQLLLSVQVIHGEYGIFHADIKAQNILYKRTRPGGYFKYAVGNDVFYVENAGILVYLADFGVSKSLLPMYGNVNNDYGYRNAEIVRDNTNELFFFPIKCKYSATFNPVNGRVPASTRLWKTKPGYREYEGTSNKFIDGVDLSPSRVVDLNNPRRFPPFEFFNDIQDVIRMFIGGKRTVQPSSHDGLTGIDPGLYNALKNNCYSENFTYSIYDIKFLRASEMLYTVYKGPTSTPLDIIGSFSTR